jgi:hypothetical protein
MTTETNYEEDFKKLDAMLSTMLYYNVIHESRINQIEELMALIYKNESLSWNQDNNDEFEEEPMTPPLYEIFELSDNKKQFLDDFIAVIQESILGDSFLSDYEEIVERILSFRS